MDGAGRGQFDGQGDVHPFLGEDALELGGADDLLARLEGLVHLAAGPADPLTGLLAGLRWQRTDLPVGQGEGGTVTGVGDARRLEVGNGHRRGERRLGLGNHLLERFQLQRRRLHRVIVRVRP
ncbi:hypothetical protein SDC9_90429 [bioreactor metagenome]|uniref:Uncharacterized protein n=1 Tax=bioreactor metagenome TaxID=1076179 RepID=A0A644ZSC0_9ZZZZ